MQLSRLISQVCYHRVQICSLKKSKFGRQSLFIQKLEFFLTSLFPSSFVRVIYFLMLVKDTDVLPGCVFQCEYEVRGVECF